MLIMGHKMVYGTGLFMEYAGAIPTGKLIPKEKLPVNISYNYNV